MSISLTLEERDLKLNPRQIRESGFIPVTVYGKSLKKSLSYQILHHDYSKLGLSKAIQTIEGHAKLDNKKHLILIKSIEKNPLTQEVLNIQFQAVDPDEKVLAIVPIEYEGASPMVQAGGILLLNKKIVKISCTAKAIPATIKFNLAKIVPANPIAYYSDLELAAGAELKSDGGQIIAKVSMPQAVKDAAKEAAAPAGKK